MKRLPGIREIDQFAGVDPIKEPIPSCRPATTRWVASRPIIPVCVVTPQNGDRIPSYRASTLPANVPARRCMAPTARYQLAARPAGLRKVGRAIRLWISKRPKAHRDLPKDAAEKSLARVAAWTTARGAPASMKPALAMQHHAESCRRVPLWRPAEDWRRKDPEIERQLASWRSRTSPWSGTRLGPKRSNGKSDRSRQGDHDFREAPKESRGAHVRDDAPDTLSSRTAATTRNG